MLHVEGKKAVGLCDGLTRRDFLRIGALGAGSVGLSLADLGRLNGAEGRDVNCILLFLVGGPSQLDTWDPKPDAPERVRGPFRPIRTNVPGVQLAETFPLMAGMADRYALVRSVYHDAAPIHETGHQLLQTGRLSREGVEHPHYGSVLSAPARPPAKSDTAARSWFCRRRWATRASALTTPRERGSPRFGTRFPGHPSAAIPIADDCPAVVGGASAHRAYDTGRVPGDGAAAAVEYDRIFSGSGEAGSGPDDG